LFTDPDWFFWACETGVFNSRPALRDEADMIHAKATSIKVPQSGDEPRLVEYNFYPDGHTSVGFDIVEESRPPHEGSTPTQRAGFIDMRIPRQQREYDKLGYKLFLKSLKFALFGGESARMTKKRCEDFFDNEDNFHRNG
jgi:hypothetical protein